MIDGTRDPGKQQESRQQIKDKAKDTGMAAVLIFLLLGHILDKEILFSAAMVALIANMVWPGIYHYPAKAWFGLSHFLGTIVSKLLLGAVFFLIVVPVGLVRRAMGKDAMQLRNWKKAGRSVFRERNHLFRAEDLEKPF